MRTSAWNWLSDWDFHALKSLGGFDEVVFRVVVEKPPGNDEEMRKEKELERLGLLRRRNGRNVEDLVFSLLSIVRNAVGFRLRGAQAEVLSDGEGQFLQVFPMRGRSAPGMYRPPVARQKETSIGTSHG